MSVRCDLTSDAIRSRPSLMEPTKQYTNMPTATPATVSNVRARCPQSVFRMYGTNLSMSDALKLLAHRASFDQLAIDEPQLSLRHRRCVRIMRDHQKRATQFGIQPS